MIRNIVFAVAFLVTAPPLAAAAGPVTGRWLTADKDAVIAVAPCGTRLCGTIDRFLVAPPQGADQRDVNNTDPAKRARKLLGMPILTGFSADGDVWRGQIYDPKSGKSYRSIIERAGNNLKVKGCLGPFCRTQVWTRTS